MGTEHVTPTMLEEAIAGERMALEMSRRLEGELGEARARIVVLENELRTAHRCYEERARRLMTAVDELQTMVRVQSGMGGFANG